MRLAARLPTLKSGVLDISKAAERIRTNPSNRNIDRHFFAKTKMSKLLMTYRKNMSN